LATLIDKMPSTPSPEILMALEIASSSPLSITLGSQPAIIMETPQGFKSLQEGIQKALVSTVKSVNRIAAEDLGFQRTVNPEVAEQIDDKAARVLQLSTRLLQSAAKACGIKAPRLEDAEDIDMSWQSIVDVVDSVLEKADTAMDEYTGLVKRKDPPSTEGVSAPKSDITVPNLTYLPFRHPSRNEPSHPAKSSEMPMLPSPRHSSRRNLTTSRPAHGSPFLPKSHTLPLLWKRVSSQRQLMMGQLSASRWHRKSQTLSLTTILGINTLTRRKS
jgi:hypothetical protein